MAAVARLPGRHVLRRMKVELPFLLSAAVLPFTADDGLRLAGTVAAKITVGVLAMIVLSSTTPFPMLLRGFELLRAPRLLVAIVAFMWRYLHVIGEEVTRMKVARQARGYSAAPPLVRAAQAGRRRGRAEHGAGGARARRAVQQPGPRGRREFGEILEQLEQTLLMVTHDLPYALQLCDRALIIDAGRIVADGPIAGLLGDAELLAAHDLELPAGFDPELVRSIRR